MSSSPFSGPAWLRRAVSSRAARFTFVLILFVLSASAHAVTEERAGKPIHFDAAPAPTTQSTGGAAAAPNNSFGMDAGRVVMALAGVLGLIFALRWGGKKVLPATLGGGRTSAVKVLARCPLAQRQQIVLLQIGKRIIVAADCSAQLTSLCQITDAEEVAALLGSLQQEKTSPASAFSSWFTQARHAFGGDEIEKHAALPADQNADIEPAVSAPVDDRIGDLTARVRDLARRFGGPGSAA